MRFNKKIIIATLSLLLLTNICSCNFEEEIFEDEDTNNITIDLDKVYSVDYGDAESFENDLNNGKNVEGKVVQFKVLDYKPESGAGVNIWAGEHLNFIASDDDPEVKSGDTMTVLVTSVKKSLNSWFIHFAIIDKYEINDNTNFFNSELEKSNNSNEILQTTKIEEAEISNPLLRYENSYVLLYERDNVRHISYIIKPKKEDLNGLTAQDFNDFIDNVSCDCKGSCNHEMLFAGLLFSDGTGIKLQLVNKHLPCAYGTPDGGARMLKGDEWAFLDISENFKFYSDEEMTNLILEGDVFDSNWFEMLKSDGAVEPIYSQKVEAEPEITVAKQETTDSPKVNSNSSANQHVDVPNQGDSVSGGVWVPTNGGTKYHSKQSCSQMVDPVQITKEDAISRGYEACGRCW